MWIIFIVYILGFLAAYIWLNCIVTSRGQRTWGYVILSFIYSLGSWISIGYSILDFFITDVPYNSKKWWLRSVPKWFPIILLIILCGCSTQKYNKSAVITIIKWNRIGELSADAVGVSKRGDTIVLPYRWYAGRRPKMDTGWEATVYWDSTSICKKGYLKCKVKIID